MVSAHRLEKLLLHEGFQKVRQHGSHAFYRNPDGRTTTIPHHAGRDISKPLLRAILREIHMPLEDFNNLLHQV